MSSFLDIRIASWFADDDHRFHAPSWCLFVYNYGLLPGQILFFGSLFVAFAAFCVRHRKIALSSLYLVLTLVLGSGCIGNVCKQFWPRPRPKQTILFGGTFPFQPFFRPYPKQPTKKLRSLPSGHATMGFYFVSLYFLGRRMRMKWLEKSGLILAFSLGIILAWARMAQGGHFLSDNIVSFVIMIGTAYLLDTFDFFTKSINERSTYAKATTHSSGN